VRCFPHSCGTRYSELRYGTFSLSPSIPPPSALRESLLLPTRLSVYIEGSEERNFGSFGLFVCASAVHLSNHCWLQVSRFIQPPPTTSSANAKSSNLANHQPAHCPRIRAGAAGPRNPIVPPKTQPSHPPTHTRRTTSSAQVAGFGSIRLQNTRGGKKK